MQFNFANFISKLIGTYDTTCDILDEVELDKIFLINYSHIREVKYDYLTYSFKLFDKSIIIRHIMTKTHSDCGYELSIDDKNIFASSSLLKELFEIVRIQYLKLIAITKKIYTLIFKKSVSTDFFCDLLNTQVYTDDQKLLIELFERLEEFEVIKNNEIDYISLESLFDFYNSKLCEQHMKREIKYIKRHHLKKVESLFS